MYDEALSSSINVCLESTLAGHGTMQRIMAAKAQGYHTIAYYIGLNSIELNLQRIAMRVARVGHDIAETLVRKRYFESADNLLKVMPSLDVLHVVDNSDVYFRLQFGVVNGVQKTHCQKLESWARGLYSNLKNNK
jgi:predicted ABC-type ATPase